MMQDESTIDIQELLQQGKRLDEKPKDAEDDSPLILLVQDLLRVRDRYGREQPLLANRVQRHFELQRGRRNIVLKARQMGMTTWIAGRFFLKTITRPGVLTVQVAQTREAAEAIFRIAQRFWERLPKELREGPLRRSRANIRQMAFPELDSEFRVLSAADENAGRGLTIQNLHCSEVSRWPGDAGETLAGLRAALSPEGELVLESTPNGAYGCFYQEWMQAGASGTARHFFPWWMEEAYVADAVTDYTDEEQELVLRHGLTPRQIGFRRGLEASYRGLRSQEFAEDSERCFRATGQCCFEIESIDKRLGQLAARLPPEEQGALCLWFPPIHNKEYLLAVDSAGGGSEGDFAVVQVIERSSGLQCAELRQHLAPNRLARAAIDLAVQYNDAEIVVERNNHGHAVLAHLEMDATRPKLYAEDGVSGWTTTVSSKARMIGRLGILLQEEPELFQSARLLQECRTYVTHANGSTGAIPGAHDDCVMAMAIAQEVRATQMERNAGRRPRPVQYPARARE